MRKSVQTKLSFLLLVLVFLFVSGRPGFSILLSFIPETSSRLPVSTDTGYSFLQRKLENGVNVVIRENPGSGIVAAEFLFKAGNMEGMDTNAGITAVIQEVLMESKVGKENLPLQMVLEQEGCLVSATVEPDYARISLLATRDIFRRNFVLLTDVLKNPTFESETVERVKKEIIDSVENNNNAYLMIHEFFLKEFYRYHPYRQSVHGRKITLERLKPETLSEFYKTYYSGNRLTVSISGDINGPDAMKLISDTLSSLPRSTVSQVSIPWEPMPQEKKLYLYSSSTTAWLYIGFPAPDIKSPDYPRMLMLSSYLGEGLSGKLFIELREKEGLAYELSTRYPMLEGPSHLIMYVMTDGKNLGRSRRRLFGEIKKVKQDLLTDDELEATRRKVLGKLLMERESNRNRAFYAAYYTSMGLGSDYDRTLVDRIKAVSAQDIRSTARKYLENFTVLHIESEPRSEVRGRRSDV